MARNPGNLLFTNALHYIHMYQGFVKGGFQKCLTGVYLTLNHEQQLDFFTKIENIVLLRPMPSTSTKKHRTLFSRAWWLQIGDRIGYALKEHFFLRKVASRGTGGTSPSRKMSNWKGQQRIYVHWGMGDLTHNLFKYLYLSKYLLAISLFQRVSFFCVTPGQLKIEIPQDICQI